VVASVDRNPFAVPFANVLAVRADHPVVGMPLARATVEVPTLEGAGAMLESLPADKEQV
jgi:hypothetical protein